MRLIFVYLPYSQNIEKEMIKTLYIIGNGFDKAHGLNSSYGDFKNWLRVERSALLNDMEDVWNCNSQLWCDFEKTLGEVDFEYVWKKFGKYNQDKLIQANIKLREFYPELPPNLTFHNLGEKLKPLVGEIRAAFNDWVLTLNQSLLEKRPLLSLNKDAFYITFNYTETLERLYDIPSSSILHIHGKANSEEELLFGHGKSAGQIEYNIERLHLKRRHTVIDDFAMWIGTLNKNVDYNLYRVSSILNKLSDVNRIYILGYSFSEIDSVYIDNIYYRTCQNHPHWFISWHNDDDKKRIQASGLKKETYTLINLLDIPSGNQEIIQIFV